MRKLLAISREERLPVLLALVLTVALNGLMVAYRYDIFTRANVGYWTVFYNYYMLSGYDDLTYVTISSWKIYYSLFRHPLLPLLMYPLYLLNHWLMGMFEMNFPVYIVAAMLTVCDVGSFLFLRRILHRVIGVGGHDATLLSLLMFGFGHVMVTAFAPDHFAISMFLLLLTLYVAGMRLRDNRPMGRVATAVLFFLTAGVTLTNGVKTLLAALWCGGRRFFRLRNLAVCVILPAALLAGAYAYQYFVISKPGDKAADKRYEQRLKTDSTFARKQAEHKKWLAEHAGEKLIDNPLFEWTDKSTSRWDAAVENLFGESVQLHRSHLLEDTNRTRPNYVRYGSVWFYVVEAAVVLLFAAGLWSGRRDRFVHMCLTWLVFDMVLHFVLGFGILEVYIMSAHWIFIVPIAYACMLRALHDRPRAALWGMRLLLGALTAWLWIYNGSLVVSHLL